MIYCHAAKISGIVYDVTCCYAAKISGIADYVTCCYACVAAMTLKSQKNAPKVFPGFPIIKSARHCGKITFF